MSVQSPNDQAIQQDVLAELKWDPRVDLREIDVAVHGGMVYLTGRVQSDAEKAAAEQAAHRISGVAAVANDLAVLPPGGDC